MNILFKLWIESFLPQDKTWRKICIAIFLALIPVIGVTLWIDIELGLLLISSITLMLVVFVVSIIQIYCTPSSLNLVPRYKTFLSIGLYIPLFISTTIFHGMVVYFFKHSVGINLLPWMGLIWFVIAHLILTLSWTLRSAYPLMIYSGFIAFLIFYSWFKKQIMFDFLIFIPQWIYYLTGSVSTLWLSFKLFHLNEKQVFSLQEKNRKMFVSIKEGNAQLDLNNLFYRLILKPYFYAFNQALMKKKNSSSLLKFSLHPNSHIKIQFLQFYFMFLIISAVAFLSLFFMGKFSIFECFKMVIITFSPLVFFTCLLYPLSIQGFLLKTKNEQSLICLCPNMGSNKVIARNIFKFYLIQNNLYLLINFGLVFLGLFFISAPIFIQKLCLLLFISLIFLNFQIVEDVRMMKQQFPFKRLAYIICYSVLILFFFTILLTDTKINFFINFLVLFSLTVLGIFIQWKRLFKHKAIFPVGRSV